MMAPDCRGHQYMMRLSNVGISFKRGLKRGLNESPQKRGTPCIKAFPCIRPCPFGRDEASRHPNSSGNYVPLGGSLNVHRKPTEIPVLTGNGEFGRVRGMLYLCKVRKSSWF